MKQQTKGGALHKLWQALPWLWMAAACKIFFLHREYFSYK